MMKVLRIKVGAKRILALVMPLLAKNLVILRGSKGYVMCGYLNLKVADKFKDIAVKIVGVSNIAEALKAEVNSCSQAAKKAGIHKGQPIREVLKIIA